MIQFYFQGLFSGICRAQVPFSSWQIQSDFAEGARAGGLLRGCCLVCSASLHSTGMETAVDGNTGTRNWKKLVGSFEKWMWCILFSKTALKKGCVDVGLAVCIIWFINLCLIKLLFVLWTLYMIFLDGFSVFSKWTKCGLFFWYLLLLLLLSSHPPPQWHPVDTD